jgi:hypothetical protein
MQTGKLNAPPLIDRTKKESRSNIHLAITAGPKIIAQMIMTISSMSIRPNLSGPFSKPEQR